MDRLDITYIFQYILNEATNNSGITSAMDALAYKVCFKNNLIIKYFK